MPRKRPKVITEEQLIAAAEHLAQSREQYITETRLIMDAFVSFSERLRTFGNYLDARDKSIEAKIEFHNSVHDSLGALVTSLTQITIALNENTEKLDRFLTKFETYFGTDRGLELEN